ncbi:inhibin beta B chain isoform X2 [Nilaparvata lugens]|uniref:inhibin beta B chain isoform X2 n=1 Tax=Nilaparvata lugens TaxID=108931 RepID=UPI00193E179B|nr:inhibin beta B chain isoform X2 [Nilaparvata lugens]
MCGRPSMLLLLVLLLSAAAAASSAETDADCDAASNADLETQLRIAQIKEEILRRLKLSEAPVVNASLSAAPHSLPAPLAHLAPAPPPSSSATPRDDVTVDKVILFPVHQGRWAYADIGPAMRRWLGVHPKGMEIFSTVYVSCSTCKIGSVPPISSTAENRPFLVLSINSIVKSRRTKRVVTCEPKTRDCCRQYLNVSFADINWDNWIVEPSYYGAYYCKGSCTTVSSLSESKNSFQMLKRDYNDSQNKTVLPSCCTPHRYGNLQIIYRIGSQLVKATLKDMTVEECKCS